MRLTINHKAPSAQQPTVELVTSHFKETELRNDSARRSWSTKQKHRDLLNSHILPRWGNNAHDGREGSRRGNLAGKTLVVTEGSRKRPMTESMANPTKQTIRNTFATLFTHAHRYEFVPTGHNLIKLVRQSGKRSRVPDILTPGEIHALWDSSGRRERAAIAIEFGNGLRISEAIGLK